MNGSLIVYVEFPSIATAFEGEVIDVETIRGGLKRGGAVVEFQTPKCYTVMPVLRPQEHLQLAQP